MRNWKDEVARGNDRFFLNELHLSLIAFKSTKQARTKAIYDGLRIARNIWVNTHTTWERYRKAYPLINI